MLGFQTTPRRGRPRRRQRRLVARGRRSCRRSPPGRSPARWASGRSGRGAGPPSTGERRPGQADRGVRLPLDARPGLCDGAAAAGEGFDTSPPQASSCSRQAAAARSYGRTGHRGHDRLADARDRRPRRRLHRRLRPRGGEPAGQAPPSSSRRRARGDRGRFDGSFAPTAPRSPGRARAPLARGILARRAAPLADRVRMRRRRPDRRRGQRVLRDLRRDQGEARRDEARAAVARRCESAASRSSRSPRRRSSRSPGRGWHSIATMRGTYQVRALGHRSPLGAIPLPDRAAGDRGRVQELARSDRFEALAAARASTCSTSTICRRDAQPEVGVVELTTTCRSSLLTSFAGAALARARRPETWPLPSSFAR